MNLNKKIGLVAGASLLTLIFTGGAQAAPSSVATLNGLVPQNTQLAGWYGGCTWRYICRNRCGWGGGYYGGYRYRCWRDWYGYRYCRWVGGYYGPRYCVRYCRWACVYNYY